MREFPEYLWCDYHGGLAAVQAPNNMAGLRVDERKHLPTLREFMAPVVEDMDPENDIDDEYRVPIPPSPRGCVG